MRGPSSGAWSLVVIAFLLACSDGDPAGATRRQTMPAQTVQTSPAPAATPAPPPIETTPGTTLIPIYSYEIVNSWPHDAKAFTQGLAYHDGNLYESTGHHGTSSLRKVELKSGKVKKKYNVPQEYFAEGMTIFEGKIFQLTWQSGKCFIYDLKSFEVRGEFHHGGEGWGLTHDNRHLIMSNGTNELRFLDPKTFLTVRTIKVFENQQPLKDLNELEFIKGEIYANLWHSERIVRIDPTSGRITGWIDLNGLRPPEVTNETDNVLNGIAYDEKEDRLFVTGKRWPKLFEIRLKKR